MSRVPALVVVVCPKCDGWLEIPAGATAVHAGCPRRQSRQPAPRYKQKKDGE